MADFPGWGQAGFLGGLEGEGEVSESRLLEGGMLGEVWGLFTILVRACR